MNTVRDPSLPLGEERRLAALRALGILDTLPEERFDAITRAAARLMKAPIALISLVDERRQWFKSRQGLPVSETPREVAFCAHAIEGDAILVVPDAAEDPRFSRNPLVRGEPRIRFYAGRPLSAPDGEKLGTLCVIDRRPRALGAAEHSLLEALGAWAEAEIALLAQCNSVNRFLDRLLAQFSEAVLLADERGCVRFANGAALALLGYDSGEIAGRPLLKLLPEAGRLRFEIDASASERAGEGIDAIEYAGRVRRRDASELEVTFAFFRTEAAGRGVTALVLRAR